MRGRERRVQVSRRGFIKGSAAGLAAGLVSAPSLGRVLGANERISVGIVGPGQRGTTLLGEFNSFSGEANAQMTAVCDIWTENLERASGRIKEWTGAEPQRFRLTPSTGTVEETERLVREALAELFGEEK